ncbi:arylesterase [Mesobacterium sp. TK19101]|uniref:Arylesterase n=1 Tax=Mesobacterium hydrothermale TaxID=3111907 RepID=A0ABU6HK36_9RHOB|nr:arylesterase [Mesobacterium sp. TK19101]MEC3862702.1 arylesterase [Mesobacterium sp. TK19101]
MVWCDTYGRLAGISKAMVVFLAFSSAAQADRVDILALGDSLTAGYGLMDHEGFVPQLRDWLGARGHDVRIVNAGVSGDTTAGGLSRVEWSLSPEIDAMIVTLGGNDMLRGLAPELARANIDGILKVAQERDLQVLLVGMVAPSNYGPDYKAAFDALYPELAQTYGTVFFPSFFQGLTENGEMPGDVTDFMQDDGIHPNQRGVARIVDAIGPSVEELIARVEAAQGS